MPIKVLKIICLIIALFISANAINYLYQAYLPEINYAFTPDYLKDKIIPLENDKSKTESNEIISPTSDNVISAITIANTPSSIPQDNRIIIPKIGVDASISEGNDSSALDHGMWRRPKSSTPDRGGNTVITGHRVLRTSGPNTFYFFHKLSQGDEVLIFWKRKAYNYKIFSIKTVSPEDIGIELQTPDPIITLYTCTPAWTSKYRLVVKAKLQ